jgi:hypothetical protein
MSNITMGKLLVHLNEQVKGMIGQKMDYGAIHRAIEVRTRPALSLFGGILSMSVMNLMLGIIFSSWI